MKETAETDTDKNTDNRTTEERSGMKMQRNIGGTDGKPDTMKTEVGLLPSMTQVHLVLMSHHQKEARKSGQV